MKLQFKLASIALPLALLLGLAACSDNKKGDEMSSNSAKSEVAATPSAPSKEESEAKAGEEMQEDKAKESTDMPKEAVKESTDAASTESMESTSETTKGDSQARMPDMAEKPNIVILATGGTIAGAVDSSIKTTDYAAGVVGVEALMNAVPEIKNLASIQGEQIANIDSADMTTSIWLSLAKRVNELLSDPKINGVVITHGTDTMEETAYFLHLVIDSAKPVVLVGAMRPSTAISADGPKNLYNAVAVATDPSAAGRGVMVALNDRIQSARFVSKTHALNVQAFSSPNSGDMGYVVDGQVFWNYAPSRLHTTDSEFDVSNLESLPRVEILYSYAEDGSAMAAEALYNQGVKGLVIAGTGAGSIHKNHKEALKNLLQKGLVVVQSSRVNAGIVMAGEEDSKLGFVGAMDLNPQKARVLLMLALTKTSVPADIAKFFEKY